jgi:hypothetical protein
MHVAFRHTLTGLLLAALAGAPLGCGGDDDGDGVDAGTADAGAVAPPTGSDVAPEPASATAGGQGAAQPR